MTPFLFFCIVAIRSEMRAPSIIKSAPTIIIFRAIYTFLSSLSGFFTIFYKRPIKTTVSGTVSKCESTLKQGILTPPK